MKRIFVFMTAMIILCTNALSDPVNACSAYKNVHTDENICFEEVLIPEALAGQRETAAIQKEAAAVKIDRVKANVIEELTYEDVAEMINASDNLTQAEKDFLCNPDLINEILKTANVDNISRHALVDCIKDMDIVAGDVESESLRGYYTRTTPNILYITDYSEFSIFFKDVIAHEYVHLLQNHDCRYRMLKEACAEIVAEEYFEDSYISSYPKCVYLTKKLMEIIGPEPVWHCTFTGDFTPIERNVSLYFNERQYKLFEDCIKYVLDEDEDENNLARYETLDVLLNVLYKNKYHRDVSEDEIIPLLEDPYHKLKRYYFNRKFVNSENSYHEDSTHTTTKTMTVDKAVQSGYIIAWEVIKEYIDREDLLKDPYTLIPKGVKRHCRYEDGFEQTETSYSDGDIRVSGYMGDVFYDKVPEEELIESGIIKEVEYFHIADRKKLTPEEYVEKIQDTGVEILYYPNRDKCFSTSSMENDMIDIILFARTYLPTIDEMMELRWKKDM